MCGLCCLHNALGTTQRETSLRRSWQCKMEAPTMEQRELMDRGLQPMFANAFTSGAATAGSAKAWHSTMSLCFCLNRINYSTCINPQGNIQANGKMYSICSTLVLSTSCKYSCKLVVHWNQLVLRAASWPAGRTF